MTSPSDQLDDLCAQLQEAATRLRVDELSPEQAATLVEDCARLAADAGAELERRVRAGGQGPPAGQGELI